MAGAAARYPGMRDARNGTVRWCMILRGASATRATTARKFRLRDPARCGFR
jgi:hypothetical protein